MDINKAIEIIKEPVHGIKFYTKETISELMKKVEEILKKLEITENTSQKNIISIVNNYIKYNVELRDSYFDVFCERAEEFDKEELVYRTAYGALVRGEAMCAGYAEAERILLSQYGIKTYTMLSKLPGKNKKLLHYVTVAEYDEDGQKRYEVLDPERQCNCEKKGMDYERYKNNMIYMPPMPIFTNDVVGKAGVGMEAEEYMSHAEIPRVQGEEQIKQLIENKRGYGENNSDGKNIED